MEKERKMKYAPPTSHIMEFDPGCILAGSSVASTDEGAKWSIDDDGTGTSSSNTGVSTGSWSSN